MATQTQFDANNTGILGRNDYKEKDNHPDSKGRAKINGLWFWISGWNRTSNGKDFSSLAFTLMTQEDADKQEAKLAKRNAPQQQPQGAATQQQAPAPVPTNTPPANPQTQNNEPPVDFDDDIPF